VSNRFALLKTFWILTWTESFCHNPHSRNTEDPIMQFLIGKSITHKTVQAGVNIHISNPEQ